VYLYQTNFLLRQLKYLIAVAQQLNFTKAAELCFVSQSTLSTGLKELEQALGAQLIERDRQNVSVTPIGKEVVERAIKLLAGAEDLVQYSQHSGLAMTGTIKLGIIPTIAPFLLPKVLPAMRKQYKNLQITLREDLTANLLQRVVNHQLDFALIALPYPTEGLLVKELFSDEFWLVAHANEPALKMPDVKVSASLSEKILLLEEGHCLRDHSLKACRQKEVSNNYGVEATSLLTLVQMVEAGLGVALLPEMAIKGGILDGTTLLARPLAQPAPKRHICLVARQTTARIDEFMAISEIITKQHLEVGKGRPSKTKSSHKTSK
jgi:LysR family hydrogen peroxide-inducible transcriptional activator